MRHQSRQLICKREKMLKIRPNSSRSRYAKFVLLLLAVTLISCFSNVIAQHNLGDQQYAQSNTSNFIQDEHRGQRDYDQQNRDQRDRDQRDREERDRNQDQRDRDQRDREERDRNQDQRDRDQAARVNDAGGIQRDQITVT